MEMDRVQTDGARGNEAGKRDKNGEEHQSKQGGDEDRTGRGGETEICKIKGGKDE